MAYMIKFWSKKIDSDIVAVMSNLGNECHNGIYGCVNAWTATDVTQKYTQLMK